jgi:mannose-6-phosphate isomerase-like protein (cupin superfamily)
MNLVKHDSECVEFLAGDHTYLQELIHPKNDGLPINYSLARATLMPGESSLLHELESSELLYILKGKGTACIGDQKIPMEKGSLVMIPAATKQYITNNGNENLVFLCIVEPFWKKESENILHKEQGN